MIKPHTNGDARPGATTVADVLLDQLAAWGVERVYGVAGDAILPLISAMAARKSPRFIPTRHEEAAVYMAKAEALLSSGLGVCIATSGPGAASLVNGLADAQTDSAPVLAITGQIESNYVGTVHKQSINQQELLGAVTELSVELRNPVSVVDVTSRAMRTALARSKATHVSVPKDFWQLPLPQMNIRPPEPYLKTPARSSMDVIRGALHLLSQSARPAILVGIGARGVVGDVLRFAERLRAPVINTLASIGQIPGGHHLNLGSVGEGGSEHAIQILKEADCVIRMGTTWWPTGYVPTHARTIDINARPEHIGMNAPTTYGIVGLLEEIIAPLLWESPDQPRPEWEARVAAIRGAWEHALMEEVRAGAAGSNHGVHPAVIAHALARHVPEDAVISLDVGDHVLWFNRHFKGSGRQDVLFSGYWRTMGFGLPAAIGAKIVQPHRASIAVVGDGGLSMLLTEWMTAVRMGVPLTVVLFNNRSLAMEEHRMERDGLNVSGVRLQNPDFARFATDSGGEAYRVKSASELDRVLSEAMRPRGPVLVDIATQAAPFPTLKVPAFATV